MKKRGVALAIWSAVTAVGVSSRALGQDPGTVLREQRVATSAGGFSGTIDNEDHFAHALASLGDVDGDGFAFAVGSEV